MRDNVVRNRENVIYILVCIYLLERFNRTDLVLTSILPTLNIETRNPKSIFFPPKFWHNGQITGYKIPLALSPTKVSNPTIDIEYILDFEFSSKGADGTVSVKVD